MSGENGGAKPPSPARPSLAVRARNSLRVAAVATVERRVPYSSPERIVRRQSARVQAIVAYAYGAVPFYGEVMRARGLTPDDFHCAADLAQLPIIEPAQVQAAPEQFTSREHGPGRRWGVHTSGSSSGLRRVVYWDDRAMLHEAAYTARPGAVIDRLAGEHWTGTIIRTLAGERRTWLQRLLGQVGGSADDHRRVSIFPTDFSSRTVRSLWSEQTLIPRRASHYDHLSPGDGFDRAIELLIEARPRVVFSFGSYADQFFRHLEEVSVLPPLPRVWVYTGDMVSPETSALAERRGCRLYSIYATTEAGGIGFQCERRRGFHLNVDLCCVRLVDELGQTVPAGESGELVVSTLQNRAMVLLNFRIGDRGALATQPCPCGRGLPLLARLEGRRSDVITLADGRRLSSLYVEGLFRVPLRATRQVQLAQSEPGTLCWRVVALAGADREQLRSALIERGRVVLGVDTQLAVEFVDEIAPTAEGKHRRVVADPSAG